MTNEIKKPEIDTDRKRRKEKAEKKVKIVDETLKKNRKKTMIFVIKLLIVPTIILMVGIGLLAAGDILLSTSLTTAGGIVAGIGFVPLIIISIFLWFKYC